MLCLNSGYLEDTKIFTGATHLVEHLLFFGQTNQTLFEAYRERYTIFESIEAKTSPTKLMIICHFAADKLNNALRILGSMIYESHLSSSDLEEIRKELVDEMSIYKNSAEYQDKRIWGKYLKGFQDPLGESLQTITLTMCQEAQDNLRERFLTLPVSGYYIGNWSSDMIAQTEQILRLTPPTPAEHNTNSSIIQKDTIWIHDVSESPSLQTDMRLLFLEEAMAEQNGWLRVVPHPKGEYWIGMKNSEIDYSRLKSLSKDDAFLQYVKDLYIQDLKADIVETINNTNPDIHTPIDTWISSI